MDTIFLNSKNDKFKLEFRNNKFKLLAPTWNDKFELPDGSYSVSDVEDYFEDITKKHQALVENPLKRIYIKKVENDLH